MIAPLIRVWLTGPVRIIEAGACVRIEGTFADVPGDTRVRLSYHPDREATAHERSTVAEQRLDQGQRFVWLQHDGAWVEGSIESVAGAVVRERVNLMALLADMVKVATWATSHDGDDGHTIGVISGQLTGLSNDCAACQVIARATAALAQKGGER